MQIKLEYRMFGLVPYNISPIQQAIQFGHAVVEYGLKYFKTREYQHWAKNHKTFIILNGGTTNEGFGLSMAGSLQEHENYLKKLNIKIAKFREPDLNDTLTAVVFLVDERVFDKKKYPGIFMPSWDKDDYDSTTKVHYRISHKKEYEKWLNTIGGVKNERLRNFLTNFKLA